MSIGSISGVK